MLEDKALHTPSSQDNKSATLPSKMLRLQITNKAPCNNTPLPSQQDYRKIRSTCEAYGALVGILGASITLRSHTARANSGPWPGKRSDRRRRGSEIATATFPKW